jgi:hypothetical protein
MAAPKPKKERQNAKYRAAASRKVNTPEEYLPYSQMNMPV